MSDDAIEDEAYGEGQQDIEVVDSGQVIGDIGDAYLQISGPGGEVTEEHVQYISTISRRDNCGDEDSSLPMGVEEEIIVETEGGPMVITGEVDDGEMAECLGDDEFIESDCETEQDVLRDRAMDEAIRDPETGNISLSMDLDDLVSRTITFDNGERIILCFSKRCQPQIAWNGHLYEAACELTSYAFTRWVCVYRGCPGSLRTSPGLKELRSSGQMHLPDCISNDLKIRRRIVIYDLRLMAEFADDPLKVLYNHFVSKLAEENPDVLDQFPPFELLQKTLARHREYKIYRRRFEFEKMINERRRGISSLSKGCYVPRVPRERPFPPSICIECGASLVTDTDSTSQEAFVDHMKGEHNREATLLYYSFHTVSLFERWMRDLQNHTRYKIRRFGIHNESLYFLCGCDDRWCRAAGMDSDGLHCTAFVRVYDYKRLRRHETKVLRIQYCLDHCFHNDEDGIVEEPYVPDVFLHELEERRKQRSETAKSSTESLKMIERTSESLLGGEAGEGQDWSAEAAVIDDNYQYREIYEPRDARDISLKRRQDNLPDSGAQHNSGESSQMADFEPGSGQSGQYETNDPKNVSYEQIYVESEVTIDGEQQIGSASEGKISSVSQDPKTQHYTEEKETFDERREMMEYVERCNRTGSQSRSTKERFRSGTQQKAVHPLRVTQREKFESYTLFNLVMQIELQTEQIRDRAQSLKLPSAAKKYLQYLSVLCDLMTADPTCSKDDRELAAEIFGIREFPPEVLIPGNILPSLSAGSGANLSYSEVSKPVIFIPVVPSESSKGVKGVEKAKIDDAGQIKLPSEEGQEVPNDAKRERENDEEETEAGAPETKKARKACLTTTAIKNIPSQREPYQTRRSRGIVKPNTTGVFDQKTYLSGPDTSYAQSAPSSSRTDEARDSSGHSREKEQVVYKRVPFGEDTHKIKIGGQLLQCDSKEMSQPFTLKTLSGNLVSVSRRPDGKLCMVSLASSPENLTLGEIAQSRKSKSATTKSTYAAARKSLKQEDEKDDGREPALAKTPKRVSARSSRKDRQDERSTPATRGIIEDSGSPFEKSASEGSPDEMHQVDTLQR